jgi:hypothetical protein
LNCPLRLGPITGGDPNFSFLGRWQSEQRCRNNPSPRLASSLNFSTPGAVAADLLCARGLALPPEKSAAIPRTATLAIRFFKMEFPSPCDPGVFEPHLGTDLLYRSVTAVSRNKILHFDRNFAVRCDSLRNDQPRIHCTFHQITPTRRPKNMAVCFWWPLRETPILEPGRWYRANTEERGYFYLNQGEWN